MAIVYFGAQVNVNTPNGNWNDIGQWYSNEGDSSSKAYTVGTLLGRLPTMADGIFINQWVTSGVAARVLTLTGINNGIWTGDIITGYPASNGRSGGVADPAATWTSGWGGLATTLNVRAGIVNCNINSSYEISGGTINGNVSECQDLIGGTINGTLSGYITFDGNPTINGAMTDIKTLIVKSGTFTKQITSWSTVTYVTPMLAITGGTYNAPSTPTANLMYFSMTSGIMAQNIFTSAYNKLGTVFINGGAFSFSGNIQVGAPSRSADVFINNQYNWTLAPYFTGTSNNITIYGSPSFGSKLSNIDAGTYTGLITILPPTGTAPATSTIFGGTYNPPAQILPLMNVAYGTGKSIDVSTIYKNPGFANFSQQLSISGSSDILQSGLA